MPEFSAADLVRSARRMRLDTLVRLRWLAVAGQATAVLVVALALGFALPLAWCLASIALSAALNLVLRLSYPIHRRLGDGEASALLAFDIVQLAALLYLTGGLENPFAMMLLAPVLISATALPPRRTLVLGLLAIIAAALLMTLQRPLPWYPGEAFALPLTYRAGVFAAILLGLSFTSVYAWRVSEEARQLAQALAATEWVLAREQHLSQLDGLAAAAAHELGTPLATITLAAKELARIGPDQGALAEDIALINTQAARCREILTKITSLGEEGAGPLESMSIGVLIEEVVGPHRPFDRRIEVRREGIGPEPSCRRNPGLLHGVGNFVENAVDFAADLVRITATWDANTVALRIEDDGPGFPPEVLARLGEPYVTTRGGGDDASGFGLGLGVFIARTLLDRAGATIAIANSDQAGQGAIVAISWPRQIFERGVLLQMPPPETPFPL